MRFLVSGLLALLICGTASAAVPFPNRNVPFPDGTIRISEAHCPAYVLLGGGPCFDKKTQRVYLGRTKGSWRLYLLAHELGHVYDARHLSYAERRKFVAALRDPRVTRWNHPVWEKAGAEQFAEVYGACLLDEPNYDDLCALLSSFKP